MAIRTVRTVGDPVLTKKCKEVKEMTPRLQELIDDMFDTMYEAGGVGLAAPQVGVLRRIIVVDAGDDPRVLVNPRIVESEGTQTDNEGCLSYPGKYGVVTRPKRVVVEGFDREMNPVRWEAEDLLARDFCHEIDHLEGKMYMDLVEGDLHDARYEQEDEQ
ncbi:MAG: peptide deformylase, partial [bacterium]